MLVHRPFKACTCDPYCCTAAPVVTTKAGGRKELAANAANAAGAAADVEMQRQEAGAAGTSGMLTRT